MRILTILLILSGILNVYLIVDAHGNDYIPRQEGYINAIIEEYRDDELAAIASQYQKATNAETKRVLFNQFTEKLDKLRDEKNFN